MFELELSECACAVRSRLFPFLIPADISRLSYNSQGQTFRYLPISSVFHVVASKQFIHPKNSVCIIFVKVLTCSFEFCELGSTSTLDIALSDVFSLVIYTFKYSMDEMRGFSVPPVTHLSDLRLKGFGIL